MLWSILWAVFIFYETIECYSVSEEKSQYHSESKSHKSSHHSKNGGYSYHTAGTTDFGISADLDLPLNLEFRYASDFDVYDPDLDPDFIGITTSFYDPDFDPDLDLDDIDLDIDLLRLKYGLYGLNHFSLRQPHFNDYKFRRRLRYHHRPYYRLRHRFLPQLWKNDLDFWKLDSYSLGYYYDKYISYLDVPISYIHLETFK